MCILNYLQLYTYILRRGKKAERFPAAFPANAGILKPTKRRTKVPQQPAIYPYDTTLYFPCNAVSASHILRPDGSGKAVVAGIGERQRFLLSLK